MSMPNLTEIPQKLECSNDEGVCYETKVTRIIDGDTLVSSQQEKIRFSLVSAPELSEPGGIKSKEFIKEICPVGSNLIIDEDDEQLQGSYGRVIAQVICNGMNLNEYLIEYEHGIIDTRFCNTSEFAQESWAKDCQ